MVALSAVRQAELSALKQQHVLPLADDALPAGCKLAGLHCRVKENKDVPDLAVLLETGKQISSAGSVTRDAFGVAPVLGPEAVLCASGGRTRALVVNSGCANAVTGARGMTGAWAIARAPGGRDTLVMSPGVVGPYPPVGHTRRRVCDAHE